MNVRFWVFAANAEGAFSIITPMAAARPIAATEVLRGRS
jgi:hypothetical protein